MCEIVRKKLTFFVSFSQGRSNIKHLQLSNKNNIDDTLADLNVPTKESSHDSNNGIYIDASESNKENSIAIFDSSNLKELSDPGANVAFTSPHPAGTHSLWLFGLDRLGTGSSVAPH